MTAIKSVFCFWCETEFGPGDRVELVDHRGEQVECHPGWCAEQRKLAAEGNPHCLDCGEFMVGRCKKPGHIMDDPDFRRVRGAR